MKSSLQLKNAFPVFCLVLTSWAVLATSSPSVSLISGELLILSDCPGAITRGTVSVSLGSIISPSGQTFLDYGFPVSTVTGSDTITGTISGVMRTCERTVGQESHGDDWVYSCYEAGNLRCSIYINGSP